MSETVMTKGTMAILKVPMTQEQREEFNETQWDAKKDKYDSSEDCLSVNYEGTLLIWGHEEDQYGLIFSVPGTPPAFYDAVKAVGLEIEEETERGFFEIWYNGADSTHDMFTVQRYREMLHDYSPPIVTDYP